MKDISGEEVRTELRQMKKGKAQAPDDIPVETWIALGKVGQFWMKNERLCFGTLPTAFNPSNTIAICRKK